MDENRAERVRNMELRFDRLVGWLGEYNVLTDEIREDYSVLDEYFRTHWQGDYEADERGEFPCDMKRGVLSQDGLYDALTEFEERTESDDV